MREPLCTYCHWIWPAPLPTERVKEPDDWNRPSAEAVSSRLLAAGKVPGSAHRVPWEWLVPPLHELDVLVRWTPSLSQYRKVTKLAPPLMAPVISRRDAPLLAMRTAPVFTVMGP